MEGFSLKTLTTFQLRVLPRSVLILLILPTSPFSFPSPPTISAVCYSRVRIAVLSMLILLLLRLTCILKEGDYHECAPFPHSASVVGEDFWVLGLLMCQDSNEGLQKNQNEKKSPLATSKNVSNLLFVARKNSIAIHSGSL